MDFPYRVQGLGNGISVWNSSSLGTLPANEQAMFREIINQAGVNSMKAQGLGQVITDYDRIRSTDQTLYVASQLLDRGVSILGILKTGRKKLFVTNRSGNFVEISPNCVLDFYVHESVQRRGMGSQLFECFLHHEKADPARLGYDRPSPKLIAFLAKHFHLRDYIPQANNFVVFQRYFDHSPAKQTDARWTTTSMRPLTPRNNPAMDNNGNAGGGAPPSYGRRSSSGRKTQPRGLPPDPVPHHTAPLPAPWPTASLGGSNTLIVQNGPPAYRDRPPSGASIRSVTPSTSHPYSSSNASGQPGNEAPYADSSLQREPRFGRRSGRRSRTFEDDRASEPVDNAQNVPVYMNHARKAALQQMSGAGAASVMRGC